MWHVYCVYKSIAIQPVTKDDRVQGENKQVPV